MTLKVELYHFLLSKIFIEGNSNFINWSKMAYLY